MKFTHLLFILLLLSSCAFEPEGLNFNDVEKPTNTHPMEITLSANEDSIYLYGETKLSFTLSTFGKQLNVAKIHFYNQEIWTDKLTYTFTILPQQTSEWVDLTVDFYVGTGTGSIADKLKVENYFMSKTWKIKYFDLTKETLKTGYIINPDGYLELYLVKPKIKEGVAFGLSRYGNTIPSSRFSGDTVFFADKTYCADATTYYLWYTFESNKTISKELIVNLPKAQLKVEALGLDSCKVSWTKSPLKLYYTINDTQYKGYGNEYKTSILLSENMYFSLGIFSPDNTTKTYSNYSVSTYFNLGTVTNYFMCYCLEKDKFYISKDFELPNILSSGLPLPSSDTDAGYKAKVNINCSPNGKYIAGFLYSQIYVYNENLSLSKKIVADEIPNYRPYYSLTNDGAFTYLMGTKILMKNLNSGADWDSFSFNTDSDPNPNAVYFSVIANSIDGKYICVRGVNGFCIYDVSDHKTAKVVYNHAVNDIGAVIAHPTNPALLYVKQSGKMQLRSCPGFDLIKTIDIPIDDYYFHSIDQYSNIMLMMKEDNYYHFIDPNTSKEVLKIKSGSMWNYNVKLLRNQFNATNNTIDLTNYLKK